jgi:hypothetical protein
MRKVLSTTIAVAALGCILLTSWSNNRRIGELEDKLKVIQTQQTTTNLNLNRAGEFNVKVENPKVGVDKKNPMRDVLERLNRTRVSLDESSDINYGRPNDYLSTKGGFKFDLDDTTVEMKYPNAPPMGLFANFTGKKYFFEVSKFEKWVMEKLVIMYYDKDNTPNAFAHVSDAYHSGNISGLHISDVVNNTRVIIRRYENGRIEIDSNGPKVDEDVAKGLLESYQKEYSWFRKFGAIDKRINDYNPKFKIVSKGSMLPKEQSQKLIK